MQKKMRYRAQNDRKRKIRAGKGFFVAVSVSIAVFLSAGAVSADTVINQKNIEDGLTFCAQYPVQLMLDGQKITFSEKDVPPLIITPDGAEAGYTLIPARALFEAMGASVSWVNETQSIEIVHHDFSVAFIVGSQTAKVNGAEKALDVPALIIDHDGDYYGSTMIPVRFAAEALGCDVQWVNETRTVAVAAPAQSGNEDPNRGDTGSRPSQVPDDSSGENKTDGTENGISTGYVSHGVETGNGTIIIEGYEFPLYDMSVLPAPTEQAKTKLIALDMGHGGQDVGSQGHKGQADELNEKDLNLAVGRRVRDYLSAAGINIYMIRENDVYIEKKERAYMANAVGADLFVSFHNNSSEYSSPNGTETHYYTKFSADGRSEFALYGIESSSVAKTIQAEMIDALGTQNRGTKSSPELAVLNKTEMPAVLVEGAFLSNESNLSMMQTQEFIERYAFACAKGIILSLNAAFPD